METILKVLAWFGLITIPKRELRIGDVFVDVVNGVGDVTEVVAISDTKISFGLVDGRILTLDIYANEVLADWSIYLFENECFEYLGNIND